MWGTVSYLLSLCFALPVRFKTYSYLVFHSLLRTFSSSSCLFRVCVYNRYIRIVFEFLHFLVPSSGQHIRRSFKKGAKIPDELWEIFSSVTSVVFSATDKLVSGSDDRSIKVSIPIRVIYRSILILCFKVFIPLNKVTNEWNAEVK